MWCGSGTVDIIAISVHSVTSIGVAGGNLANLWALAQRVAAWNASGRDWIMGGDWNADIDALSVRQWAETRAGDHFC